MFSLIIGFFVFLLGLCVGSFLNVIINRLTLNTSLWENLGGLKGRSYCPHCKHQLNWLDLIPVISFLWLGGKCRYCQKKISVQYPLVEILTGLIFLFVCHYQTLPFTTASLINIVFLWYIASSLIIILVYDLKHYLIPDVILFPAIVAALLYGFFEGVPYLYNHIFAALIASGFFLFIFLISKGKWLGFGDVKLAILLGLLLGFPHILAGLFLAFFFGSVIGIGLIFGARKGLKSEVPFAPFLITGTFVALFFGDQIIQWYVHFLIF